jgi:hypothetical protein
MTDTRIDEKALERAAEAVSGKVYGGAPEWSSAARSAITAYLKAREEAGFVEVPREPTEEMHSAFHDCAVNTYNHKNLSYAFALHAYRAMLAARPK